MTQWWRGAVIYHIYPRSFCDADDDGVGDLPGVIAKLDYVRSLGVDAIWLSPFFVSPMIDFGYDVENFCAVDPTFGTMDDFDCLVRETHRHGMKLIIDQIYSHSSDRHPWFADSRCRTDGKADWYVWADAKPDGSPPNNWLSFFGGPAWNWDMRRRQYYMHNFLPQQPDLNLRNPEVQDAILDVARFWLDKGVDGFRLDAANFMTCDAQLRDNPPADTTDAERPYRFQRHRYDKSQPATIDFVKRLRRLLDDYSDRMAVAEIEDDEPIERTFEYTCGTDRLHTAYNFVYLSSSAPLTAKIIRQAQEDWLGKAGEAWPSWAFSNHDVPRVLSRWGGPDAGPALAKLLLGILISLRGTVFVYQGEELGLPQADVPFECLRDPEALRNWPLTMGRDGSRTPMVWAGDKAHAGFTNADPWLPVDPAVLGRAVDKQENEADSPLATARKLIGLRRDNPALRYGGIDFRDSPEPVLAFIRAHEGARIACLFNLGRGQQCILQPDFEGARILDSGLNGTLEGRLATLPEHGGLIVRLAD